VTEVSIGAARSNPAGVAATAPASGGGRSLPLVGIAVVAGWLALWSLVVLLFGVSKDFLPPPWDVVRRLIRLAYDPIGDGTLAWHLWSSLVRFFSGFLIAAAIGIPLGMIMARVTVLDRLVRPVFELLRPIPPIAWAPFAILWFGASLGSQAFVICVSALPPMLINAYRGVGLVDDRLIAAARTLGAGGIRILTEVALPASLPMIVAGLRIGLATGWMALIAAEIVAGDGASSGLGFLILIGQRTLQADLTIGAMAVIGLAGATTDWLIARLQRRLMAWSQV
jgi:ABC-type nitrate/sulfonate/bicarbonate transport system permease component